MAARAKRILSEKPSLPTPELGTPLSILCFVGEGIGEDQQIRKQIESFASESNVQLNFSEDEKRDHAIHATVPANQTERSLQSLCAALDLLAQ
jgi:phosphoheptose isomerase